MSDLHPRNRKLAVSLPAQGTAGGTSSAVVGEAPYDGVVKAVTFIPNATITGASTNNRKFALVNKKQDGSGTTEIASVTYNNGTNAAGFDRSALTLSGTAANLEIDAGDVLAVVETVNGSGMTHSGGRLQVEVALA